jgi:hypothetical protein
MNDNSYIELLPHRRHRRQRLFSRKWFILLHLRGNKPQHVILERIEKENTQQHKSIDLVD